MSVTKQERHEQELNITRSRHEAGVIAVHKWLCRERDEINARWFDKSGEDLLRLQGEAKHVARLIRVVEQGPTIKSLEGSKT